MQQVFTEYPALYGTDDILYHIGRLLETIENKPTQDTPAIIDGLKTAISVDANLQNALRGLNGSQVENFGRSLLKNSAFEYGFNDWSNIVANGKRGALPIGKIQKETGTTIAAENINKFLVKTDMLYKAEFNVADFSTIKSPCFLVGKMYDNTGVRINRPSTDNLIYLSIFTGSTNLTKVTAYFGGVGTGTKNFTDDTMQLSVYFIAETNTTFLEIDSLAITPVMLSEPVPYTLPYLPTGQIVYDPATNDVGRFNGTDINWFM